MKNKLNLLAWSFVVAGVLILLFPYVSEKYHDYKQAQMLNEWAESFQSIEQIPDAEETDSMDKVQPEEPVVKNRETASAGNDTTDGILMIDKIGLKLPILEGATQHNLRTTVASINNTGFPGEVGNYAIAGHRNYTYGRNFNRLNELQVDDRIGVNTGRQQFEYAVTEKLLVKPDEVWVLEPNGKDKEITLVTCHPVVNPTHRLIIKGKMIEPATHD